MVVPTRSIIRNTPLDSYGERLNYDLGIYAQDSWTLKRLTVNAGIRWEALNAQVDAGDGAGGPVRARAHASPGSRTCRTGGTGRRASRVYDLFGNAKTAIKYSLNRYNLARTTGIAADYNPLVSRRRRRTCPLGATSTATTSRRASAAATSGRPGCPDARSISAALPANFGVAALNDVRRLSADLEPRARPRAAARADAAAVGDRQLVPRRLPQPDDDHQPELQYDGDPRRTRTTCRIDGPQPADRRADHGVRPARRPRRARRH